MADERLHVLSKTAFMRGTRCLKSLYLQRRYPDLCDPPDARRSHVFAVGAEVGRMARELFPGGVLALPEEGASSPGDAAYVRESLRFTEDLISRKVPAIYEASFLHNGVLCYTDILACVDGSWRAFEAKSATRLSEWMVLDAALQHHVITRSGLALDDISVVFLDGAYRLRGGLDLQSLFTIRSVKKNAVGSGEKIDEDIARQKTALEGEAVPDVEIGGHCFSPYICDFFGHCWKNVPPGSVFEIRGIDKGRAVELHRSGIRYMEDVPDDYPLSSYQRRQIDCARTRRGYTDRRSLCEFVSRAEYPLFFMDFEAAMPPVPRYEGTGPYQPVPFLYSLHIIGKRGDDAVHRDYIARRNDDPRGEFIDRLLEDTAGEGSVFVYGRALEDRVLRELAHAFPERAAAIGRLRSRIVDLMGPFLKMHRYEPAMRGKLSLKETLPAIVPDMDYRDLAIGDGFSAMIAWERISAGVPPEEEAALVRDLRKYCARDTLAMAEIFKKLENDAGGR